MDNLDEDKHKPYSQISESLNLKHCRYSLSGLCNSQTEVHFTEDCEKNVNLLEHQCD